MSDSTKKYEDSNVDFKKLIFRSGMNKIGSPSSANYKSRSHLNQN